MIEININKAKIIAHQMRRVAREQEFRPYDELIARQIPGTAEEAEAQRQLIREKYALIQQDIDSAATVDELTNTVHNINN